MSDKIVPLISSGTAGPLGVVHLPRLWQKASLGAAGKLADGYDACGQGYDQMLLDGLGISRDSFLEFMKSKPSYTQLEAWVKEQPGAKVDGDSISATNGAIGAYIHADDTRAGIFAACGLDDNTCGCRDAVNLNNLDDWQEFYNAEIK